MSERNKPHNGRDLSGNAKVDKADVADLRTEPDGEDIIRDSVRHGGAVEDVGLEGVERAKDMEAAIRNNRGKHGPRKS